MLELSLGFRVGVGDVVRTGFGVGLGWSWDQPWGQGCVWVYDLDSGLYWVKHWD